MEISLRSEQKRIMKYKGGRLGIPAVPGAGKTFILSCLVSKLLKRLGENEEILILTYMNSSVLNFRERIEELLGEDRKSLKGLKVMTIHRLASEILKENRDITGLSEDYKVLTSANMYYLMSKSVNEYKEKYPKDFEFFIDNQSRDDYTLKDWTKEVIKLTLKLASKCKNNGISSARLYSTVKKYRRESMLRILGGIYYKYDKACREEGYLDYDDLLYLCYKLLRENPRVAERYKKRFRYILEDEAQDSNTLQNKILKLIVENNLVKVGDLNQNILSTFTNSDPKLFRDFLKVHPKVEMFKAGRSSREIIGVANSFLEDMRKNHPLKEAKRALEDQRIKVVEEGEYPKNPKPSTFGITTIQAKNEYQELEKMSLYIKMFVEKYPEKRVAVLIPNNYKILKAGRELKKQGVKFQVLADISEKLVEVLEFLGDLLLFLSTPFDNNKYLDLLGHKIEKIDDERVLNYLRGISLEKLFFDVENLKKPDEIMEGESWKEVEKINKKIKVLLEFPQNSLERLLLFIGDLFNFDIEEQLFLEKIIADLKRIFKLNPTWTLYDLAMDLKKARSSDFAYLAKIVEEEAEKPKDEKYKVTLSTYHRSKGMEWDLVWLYNLNSNTFPVYLSDDDYGMKNYLKKEYRYPGDTLEGEFRSTFITKEYENINIKRKIDRIGEGVRLIYVGITRAREYLVVSSNKSQENYYFKRLKDVIEKEKKEYEGHKKTK